MANNTPLGSIDLGLGGMGDMLTQQMKDDEIERKKKLLAAGNNQQSAAVKQAGMGVMSLLGKYSG